MRAAVRIAGIAFDVCLLILILFPGLFVAAGRRLPDRQRIPRPVRVLLFIGIVALAGWWGVSLADGGDGAL